MSLLVPGCSGEETYPASDQGVDVDFSALNSIMAQAALNNIARHSADYIGKTIKVRGAYYSIFPEQTGQHYHYVTIVDGDACCRQGFEFRFTDDKTYPDDYPDENEVIEVIGVLGRYEEFGSAYLYLAVDEITVLIQ